MKKKLSISLFLIIFSSLYMHSLENFKFSVTPVTGVTYGTVYEYVFEENCLNTNNMMSRLNWDAQNLFYAGLNLEADIFKHLNISFNGKFYIPKSSGRMQDFDWLNSVPNDSGHYEWIYDDPTELTHYSNHENTLDHYYTFTLSAGKNFNFEKISLTPYIAWEYSFIGFISYNGYKIYKANNFVEKKIYGTAIYYDNELNSLLLGIKARFNPFEHFSMAVTLSYSPNLTFITALDNHFITHASFYDKISFTSQFNGSLISTYRFNQNHSINLNLESEFVPVSKGPDYKKDSTKWVKTIADGATSRFLFTAGISYTYSF